MENGQVSRVVCPISSEMLRPPIFIHFLRVKKGVAEGWSGWIGKHVLMFCWLHDPDISWYCRNRIHFSREWRKWRVAPSKIGSSTDSLWPLQFLLVWGSHQLRCHCARPGREIKNWALRTEKNGAHARHRTALAKPTARMSRNLQRALEINKISSPRASAHGIDHDIYLQIIEMLTHWIKVIDRSINEKRHCTKKSTRCFTMGLHPTTLRTCRIGSLPSNQCMICAENSAYILAGTHCFSLLLQFSAIHDVCHGSLHSPTTAWRSSALRPPCTASSHDGF